jgi:hypothetical protein
MELSILVLYHPTRHEPWLPREAEEVARLPFSMGLVSAVVIAGLLLDVICI